MIYTLLMFLGTCCSAIDETNAAAVVFADEVEGVRPAVDCYDVYDEPQIERVQRLFVGRHNFAGLATRVAWSPRPNIATSPAWCLVVVERNGNTRLAVRRDTDEKWSEIDMGDAPWFAASSAGAMRGWLDGDFSSPLRYGGDPRLLGAVRSMVVPPVREDGRI